MSWIGFFIANVLDRDLPEALVQETVAIIMAEAETLLLAEHPLSW